MNKNPLSPFIYRLMASLALFSLILGVAPPSMARAVVPSVRYVQAGGLTGGACESWEAACELQYALSIAVSGDELWVMQGTYKPTTGNDRNATFTLKKGVALYGGFAGTETARDQRDWIARLITLSGDIGAPGNNSDNSYNVVYSVSTDSTAVLDGFTVTSGAGETIGSCMDFQPFM